MTQHIILVLGGTGRTGQEIITQALEQGHIVKVLARNPQKLTLEHARLLILKGDPLDPATLSKAAEGCDSILNTLGLTHLNPLATSTLYQKHAAAIIEAAQNTHVPRIITVTTILATDQPNKNLPFWVRYVFKPVFWRAAWRDMMFAEKLLMHTSFAYTIVRPPGLVDGELTGEYRHAEGYGLLSKGRSSISRADLAHFMLRCLNEELYIKQGVAIMY